MIDFDPGFHDHMGDNNSEEDYDAGYEDCEDSYDEPADGVEIETDEFGNPIYLAAAAGFGYHMAQEDLEAQKIADDITESRKDEPKITKMPLSSRHGGKDGEVRGKPFERWLEKYFRGEKKLTDPLDLTEEERNSEL